MASKSTWVCVPCRHVSKDRAVCVCCGADMHNAGKRWSAPKKNNDRAWKRIEKGEWLWDRRRVRRGKRKGVAPETVRKVKRVKVQAYPHPEDCDQLICKHFGPNVHWGMWKMEEVPGTERIVPNMRQYPIDTDMGG